MNNFTYENPSEMTPEQKLKMDAIFHTLWKLMTASAWMKVNNKRANEILEVVKRIIALGNKIESSSQIQYQIKEDLKEIFVQDQHLGWLLQQQEKPDIQNLGEEYYLKCSDIFAEMNWKMKLHGALKLALREHQKQKAKEIISFQTYLESKRKLRNICYLYKYFVGGVFWSDPGYIQQKSHIYYSYMLSDPRFKYIPLFRCLG